MFHVNTYGDRGLIIRFGNEISKETNKEIRNACEMLQREPIHGVIEWIPSYISVTLFYNPSLLTYLELKTKVIRLLSKKVPSQERPSQIIEIPTCYGGEFGPDLSFVANYHGLKNEEIISIHCNRDYLIYMMGFTPGFPYLGGMSKRIATPRLETPRLKTPAGSVGIAGEQTGIYSLETPGGWRIIGKTPLKLLNPKASAFLLETGNYVRFIPISKKMYKDIEKEIHNGTYNPVIKTFVQN